MNRVVTLPALLALLTLLGAGCGGDALSEDQQQAADTIAGQFGGEDPSEFEKGSSACLGEELVRALGTEALVEAGMLTEELEDPAETPKKVPRDIAEGYAEAIVSCQDVAGEIADRRTFYPNATDEDVAGYVACVEDIDPELLRDAVIESSADDGDPERTKPYFDAAKTCEELLGEADFSQ